VNECDKFEKGLGTIMRNAWLPVVTAIGLQVGGLPLTRLAQRVGRTVFLCV